MEEKAEHLKRGLTWALIVLLVISGVLWLRGYWNGQFDSVDSFQTYIKGFGLFAPLVLTVIQAIQVILPVLPGFLGCIVGAGMFGAAGGFWCNYIGISVGSIIAFWLARQFGVQLVQRMVPMEKYRKWTDWVNTKKSYTVVLALAILLPLAPDDFLCYFSGLTGMPARRFTWIILMAKPWCILAYSMIFGYIL
ncbi:MAG: VTT domain-containing protein [Bacillota bacterium]|nr:VTT domain-containing protein [Bacillota bacterium]